MKYHTATRGTTLIELILYLAISAGLIVGVGAISLNVLEQREKARAIDDLRYMETHIMTIIREDIRSASGVLFPAMPTEATTTLLLSSQDPLRDPIVIEAMDGTLYRTIATGTRVRLLPESIVLSDPLFTRIEGAGAAPSVFFTGILQAGGEVGTSYRAELPLETSITLRAPAP